MADYPKIENKFSWLSKDDSLRIKMSVIIVSRGFMALAVVLSVTLVMLAVCVPSSHADRDWNTESLTEWAELQRVSEDLRKDGSSAALIQANTNLRNFLLHEVERTQYRQRSLQEGYDGLVKMGVDPKTLPARDFFAPHIDELEQQIRKIDAELANLTRQDRQPMRSKSAAYNSMPMPIAVQAEELDDTPQFLWSQSQQRWHRGQGMGPGGGQSMGPGGGLSMGPGGGLSMGPGGGLSMGPGGGLSIGPGGGRSIGPGGGLSIGPGGGMSIGPGGGQSIGPGGGL